MSESDWEKLAELLKKVVSGPGSYKEKAKLLAKKMHEDDASAFDEIVSWFGGDADIDI